MTPTLKNLRQRSDLTQEQVAQELNISISYYSLLENGKRRLSLDLAKNLAQVLKCSLDDIFYAYKVCDTSTKEVSADG